MKKIYVKPVLEVVPFATEIMDVNMYSVHQDGTLSDGTQVGIGDDIGEGEDIIGDARRGGNLWDGWDD